MPARRLRQYYLGPSSQGTLSVTLRPPLQPSEPLGKSYISMLPDELLAEIFAYLPPKTILDHPPTYNECPPVAIICKRWERLYDATMYRTISFVDWKGWQEPRSSTVVKTVRQQANLRKHVRDVFVETSQMGDIARRECVQILNSCRTIRFVSLSMDWSHEALPIIQAVGMLPRLEVVRLSGYYTSPGLGPDLHMIMGLFSCPTLKSMRLSRYGFRYGLGIDLSDALSPPVPPASKDEMEKFSIAAHSNSSAIMSLELDNPDTVPGCTITLLNWPSRLVKLSLSRLNVSNYGKLYMLNVLKHILGIHRESLQHIEVGIIPASRDEHDNTWIQSGIPDFSQFPCLHDLHLSAYNILVEQPSKAAAKVAAPVLRHLAIIFSTENEYKISYQDFREGQVNWMAGFASQISISNNELQSVFIDFDPGFEVGDILVNSVEEEVPIWPWEYLQQAEKEMSHCHISMRYSVPGCTKDEWDHRVRVSRKEAEVARDSFNIKTLEKLAMGEAGEKNLVEGAIHL